LADWLPTAALDLSWGTTIIAVSPTGDEAICRSLHRLMRAGLNPVLVVVEPHGQFGVIRERARRLGLTAHLVANESDLKRWGANQRLAIAS
jgi:choline kinase